jgi:hypothetical protein
MFLLDTNVVSDIRRPKRLTPHAARWFSTVPAAQLHISTVTVFEIQHGIIALGRRDAERASHLQQWLEASVLTAFDGRIVPLDTSAALRSAELHRGRTRIDADRLIAAVALVHGMTLVTRNTRDFAGMGVKVLDPFVA